MSFPYNLSGLGKIRMKFAAITHSKICYLSLFILIEYIGK